MNEMMPSLQAAEKLFSWTIKQWLSICLTL